MFKERTIMIFPDFSNIDVIDAIRERYDPLVDLIRPHITLVFPFRSEMSDEEILVEMERQISCFSKFYLRLQGISKKKDTYGNYLFLRIIDGLDEIIELHDMLYKSTLEKYQKEVPYIPHMTIGNLNSEQLLDEVYSEIKEMQTSYETVVDKIFVEMIGEYGESIIEMEYMLS